eukprot:3318767-Alexandrium_andersonii.AAC.1
MSASLVGSEMCIRDSAYAPACERTCACARDAHVRARALGRAPSCAREQGCLLYTSDAADDM